MIEAHVILHMHNMHIFEIHVSYDDYLFCDKIGKIIEKIYIVNRIIKNCSLYPLVSIRLTPFL